MRHSLIKALLKNKIWLLLSILPCLFAMKCCGNNRVLSCRQILEGNPQLCDQIGQMLIIGFGGYYQDKNGKALWEDKDRAYFNTDSAIAKHIEKNHIGGVILFSTQLQSRWDERAGGFILDRNVLNPGQVTELNKRLQEYNKETREAQGLEPLNLFISVDQEGGSINRLQKISGFSVVSLLPQALGYKEEQEIMMSHCQDYQSCAINNSNAILSSRALNETYTYAREMSEELSRLNFNLNFAPVVDINLNPTNPIIGGRGRSFSANPQIVVDQAEQFIKGFHDHNVIATLKHFPGHGSSTADSHLGLVDVTSTYKSKEELFPYEALIAKGYNDIIMTTHVINGQLDRTQCKAGAPEDAATWCPGTMSKKTLTDLLRTEMGFKGLIVSDDMTMGAITDNYDLSTSLEKAINAGVDMFIVANNQSDLTEEVIMTIAQLVKSGKVTPEKINEAYQRISNFKKIRLK